MKNFLSLLALMTCLTACQKKTIEELKSDIQKELNTVEGRFAVAFKDLTTGETILISEDSIFHAASTMKVPVMIEVFKQAKEGKFSLTDSIEIKNEFKSIVDSSLYSLSKADDSDTLMYEHIGERRSISSLMYDMIIVSSNLATNLIINKVGAHNAQQTVRGMGTRSMKVLRGVEDSQAYEAGLINTTTAYDLMTLFEKIARFKAVDSVSSVEMIRILLDQKFNDIIPAKLPADVKVAHKTGWITGVHHDAGIVFLPDGRKYVLILLSKNLKVEDAGVKVMANVSKIIYDWVQ